MAAAAPPGHGAAGMRVDETSETPAQRLDRLKVDVHTARKKHGKRSVEYLKAAADLAWAVSDRADDVRDELEDELKQSPEDGELAARVDQAEAEAKLAQAEAKLAQAEAKLAQAEADDDKETAKALDNKVAALQAEVTRIKTQHPPPAFAGQPPAKRLRVRFGPGEVQPVQPEEVLDPPLHGRKEALAEIEHTIRENAANHGVELKRQSQRLLAAVGHVRVGKSRLAREVVRLINKLRVDSHKNWLKPLLLTVNFQNGSNFVPSMDGPAIADRFSRDAAGRLLGVRLAAAAQGLYRGGEPAQLKGCNLDEVTLDLVPGKVISHLVRHVMGDQPDGARLPIVVHLDEYGYFVRDTGKNATEAERKEQSERAVELLLQMVRRVANDLMLCGHIDADVRNKFFIVPIITGTSFHDVRLHPTGFIVSYLPTPLLAFDKSEGLMHDFWALRKADNKAEMPEKESEAYEALRIGLSDAGGFPGLVEMLARVPKPRLDAFESPQYLKDEFVKYAHPVEKPAKGLWSLLVRLMLTRERVERNRVVSFVDGEDREHRRLVGELLDKGYVSATSDQPAHLGPFTLGTAMCAIRAWPLDDGVLNLAAMPDPAPTTPWTWQQFEIMHANHVAAVLAAMFHVRAQYSSRVAPSLAESRAGVRPSQARWLRPAPLLLGRLLRGVKPEGSPLMHRTITSAPVELPWGDDDGNKGVIRDKHHVLLKKKKADQVPFDLDGVHLCADGNPVVDAYVNLELDNQPATVFYQYKHSKLTANGSLAVQTMNEDHERLCKYLKKRRVWRNRVVVLVYVTNRTVVTDGTAPRDGLFYVSHDELAEHLGAEFAGRGLVPVSVARGE